MPRNDQPSQGGGTSAMFHIPRRAVGFAGIAAIAIGLVAAGCGSSSSSSGGGGKKIALLLPENKTARYETPDRPPFQKQIKADWPNCTVIYSKANQDPAKQPSQAQAGLSPGRKG